ncbi:hypothetical protein MUK42_12537 [Musa troglodytarum]|uniref:Uncharacterized protein n=1 Tax=Musa troglodytarum TaxID=320322 RepID=A0A9E7KPB9_9LILI|nr:hypothetical protein MUK42_12537 [Musa troglodytarum]
MGLMMVLRVIMRSEKDRAAVPPAITTAFASLFLLLTLRLSINHGPPTNIITRLFGSLWAVIIITFPSFRFEWEVM